MGGFGHRPAGWRFPAILIGLVILAFCCTIPSAVWAAEPFAGMVVLANRSPVSVAFRVAAGDGRSLTLKLAPRDLIPLPVTGVVPLEFGAGSAVRHYALVPPGVYVFANDTQKHLDLVQIGLRPPDADPRPQPPAGVVEAEKLDELGTIQVKLLVDDSEVTLRRIWEPRLRERIAAVSQILQQTCRIRLVVAAVDTWHSDPAVVDFDTSLREFELSVRPEPAAIAIGFTSRYAIHPGKQKLGATRTPLYPYILIREHGPSSTERERTEVLLHELGHFLGAAHSPERNSVMRPDLADQQSNRRDFRIMFDPVNALAMNLVGQQWRFRGVRRIGQIDVATRGALSDIYASLDAAYPGDPVAGEYLKLVRTSDPAAAAPNSSATAAPLTAVIQAIVAADLENTRSEAAAETSGRSADELAALYFRAAAGAAARLPEKSAGDAMLLGLGLALGHQPALTGEIRAAIGAPPPGTPPISPPEIAGRPGMQNRADLLQRFVVSAAYSRLAGPSAAEAGVLARQAERLRRGAGFSFVEITADFAGIRFAQAVSDGHLRLADLAGEFTPDGYLPSTDGLEENILAADFAARFGSLYDRRCQTELARIKQRINALTAYQPAP